MAVICVMITDYASFESICSSPSGNSMELSSVPNLSCTLQETLSINDGTATDDDSIIASLEDYGIDPNHVLVIDSGANLTITLTPIFSLSETISQQNLDEKKVQPPCQGSTYIGTRDPSVICPGRAILLELQLTDALVKISSLVKQNNVANRIEYFDAIMFKLLCIVVTNSLHWRT